MSKFTTMKGPHNSLRYKKDGKMISPKEIPENILQVLQHNPVFNEEDEPVRTDKACIFCGTHSNLTRVVNLQVVSLCTDHYYSETIGKIAQHLRSNQDGQTA